MALEYICHNFLKQRQLLNKVYTKHKYPTLDEIIDQLDDWGVFPDTDFRQICDRVRLNRNSSVHYNFKNDIQSTIKTLPALKELATFLQNYNEDIVAEPEPEYITPSQNIYEAKLKTLNYFKLSKESKEILLNEN